MSANTSAGIDTTLSNEPGGSVDVAEFRNGGAEIFVNVTGSGSDGTADLSVNFTLDTTGAVTDNRIRHVITDGEGNEVTAAYKSFVNGTQFVESGDSDFEAFDGELITVDAGAVDTRLDVYNLDGDRQRDGRIIRASTSPGDVFNIDTASDDFEAGGTYQIALNETGNSNVSDIVNVTLLDLGLSAEALETDITTDDSAEADIESNAFGDAFTAELLNSDGDTVETITDTFDGSGSATVSFDAFSEGDTGDFTIEVTHNATQITAETGTISVGEAVDTDAQITSVVGDQRGDVSEITISLTQTDTATLTLGSDDAGYEANVSVTDGANGDADGEVTVEWNTFLADGSGDEFSAADSDDSVTVDNVDTTIGSGPSHIIATGTYDLEVVDTDDPADDPTDLDSVTLSQRSTDAIQTWTAPADTATANVLDAVVVDDEIATEDLVVTQIDATGLEGAFESELDSNTNDSVAFQNLSSAGVLNLTHEEVVGQASNRQPAVVDLNDTGLENFTVVADTENDTYYFVQDTGALSLSAGTDFDTTFTLFANQSSQSNFGLVAPEGGEFSDETLEDSFSTVERAGSIDVDDASDEVRVRQDSDQTITGTSSVAPGTDLNVRIQSASGSSSQFVIGPRTVEVQDDGTWSVAADFSSYNVGAEFNVRLTEAGATEFATTPVTESGQIRGPPEVIDLQVSDQTGAGEVFTVDAAELNYGGFIAIHQGSPSGDVIGHSSFIDENTRVTNLRFALDQPLTQGATLYAMPHLDTDGDEEYEFTGGSLDSPYTSNGEAVTREANYTLEGAEADFQVSGLSPMDVTVTQGDVIDAVSATVTNEGNAAGTQTVEFRVGGSAVASQEVTLDVGASQTVEFTDIDTTGLSTGDLTHGVYTDDSQQTATLTVEEPPEANFQVSGLSPMDVTVTQGDVINVSATVTNEGDASGTQTVEFRVGGSAVASQEVSLDAGASETVEFTGVDTSGLSTGDLTHGVFTDDSQQTATLTVEAPSTPTPSTPTPSTPTPSTPTPSTPTPSGPDMTTTDEPADDGGDGDTTTTGDSGPGFGIVVSVLALLGAALLAARRNN